MSFSQTQQPLISPSAVLRSAVEIKTVRDREMKPWVKRSKIVTDEVVRRNKGEGANCTSCEVDSISLPQFGVPSHRDIMTPNLDIAFNFFRVPY